MRALCFLFLGTILSHWNNTVFAETAPMAPFEFSGYIDVYYQNSPQAHDPTPPATGPAFLEGRVFDAHHNEMTLNMVELSARRKMGEVSFRVDLGFGHMIDALAGSGTLANGQPAAANSQEPTRNIPQAFVTYSPSLVPRLAITAGKFNSHMGIEVTRAKDNWQYSRSLTFNYAIPFWHEGLNVSYGILQDQLTATFYLVNAWDGRISADSNKSPTVGFNLNSTPGDGLVANYNYIGGAETGRRRREVHEINFLFAFNAQWSAATDLLLGRQEQAVAGDDARWSGLVFYAKYTPRTWYSFSPRYEISDDSHKGYILGTLGNTPSTLHKIHSLTLSNNFTLGDGLEARLEYRSDKSNEEGYFKNSVGGNSNHQTSYTAAILYNF